ncbi:hypothetical protein C0995_015317 [Termitomyces sp. Mi166|nr:hypothetical protein C0995_015317 [Termitomyces sp. Mi166\
MILKKLCLSQEAFFLKTQEFFKNLRCSALEATVEVWADCILMFSKLYEQGDLSPHQLGLLQGDTSLHDKLCNLVAEIYVSSLLGEFENLTDATYSFHIQKGTTMAQRAPNTTTLKPTATNLNNWHQNNLKVASTFLQGLNPVGGLFEQAVAREHLVLPALPAPIKEDVCSKHMLSYVNKPDVSTILKQVCPEFEQDQPPHMSFQCEKPPHLALQAPPPSSLSHPEEILLPPL